MPCGCSEGRLPADKQTMDILYLLIPMSVALVFVIAAVFWWSLKSGQFDDLEGPGHRVLMDDDRTDVTKNGGKVDSDQSTAGDK